MSEGAVRRRFKAKGSVRRREESVRKNRYESTGENARDPICCRTNNNIPPIVAGKPTNRQAKQQQEPITGETTVLLHVSVPTGHGTNRHRLGGGGEPAVPSYKREG